MIVAGCMATIGTPAQALTADEVLNSMSADQQSGYLAGIVDGLAYSRWVRDKPDASSTQCVYRWFYDGKIETQRKIDAWFERHLDRHADALIYALIKKECGE